MPEGPEIHLAARFINECAAKYKFGGPVVKSEVSTKSPSIGWTAQQYCLRAESRGKELKLHLTDRKASSARTTTILIRFGMTGSFQMSRVGEADKHAHLMFNTLDGHVLAFVDPRRFGRWEEGADWGKDRGPDPVVEHPSFRENVLSNLKASHFDRPICETLLNQKFFNGIGNYLRAEILFRAGIRPFDRARDVLDPAVEKPAGQLDILELCHQVPLEVIELGCAKNYDLNSEKSMEDFTAWLRCYSLEGMKNLQDGNGRTIWFAGEPGSMAPKAKKVKGRVVRKSSAVVPVSGKKNHASKAAEGPQRVNQRTGKKMDDDRLSAKKRKVSPENGAMAKKSTRKPNARIDSRKTAVKLEGGVGTKRRSSLRTK